MAINKIVLNTDTGEQVLVDLTGDTVNADSLVVGSVAHGADGEIVEGANPYELEATNAEVGTQTDLIAQIGAALEGKAAPSGGIVPVGTIEITENGEHDVTVYAKALVNVPSENLVETCTVTLDNYSLGCDCSVEFLSAMVLEDGAIKNFVVTLKKSDTIYTVTIPNAVCGSTICLVSSFYTGYNEEPYVEITGSATFAAWEGIWPDRKYMRLDFIAPTVANEDCTIKYSYVP